MGSTKSSRLSRLFSHCDAHHRFAISSAVVFLGALILHGHVGGTTEAVALWNVFTFTTLALAWAVILTTHPYQARRCAKLQDGNRTLLFILVVGCATASLFAVGILLGSARNLPPGHLAGHVSLSVAAIILSWFLVHTLFTLRYAHHYYADAHSMPEDKTIGGLVFPGDEKPDFLDFAYFSFIIGMTCQVSDVQITSRAIRRLALVHGVITFGFNTAIVAMLVNIVAGLI